MSGQAREAQRRELWAAVEELVALGRGLYPPALARTDLPAALREVAARLSVPVELDVRGEPDELRESHRAAVWFVCSEALTNIVRHANATRVAIRLNAGVGETEIEVTDDRVGGASLERGLRGLADRVEALGGSFTLSSPRGGPTVVRAVLPYAAPRSSPARRRGRSRASDSPGRYRVRGRKPEQSRSARLILLSSTVQKRWCSTRNGSPSSTPASW